MNLGFINKDLLKKCLIYVFFFGFLCYGYHFFNFNPSGDSLELFYLQDDYLYSLASNGRILRPLLNFIRGSIESPVLIGFFSLIFISISVYFILDTFNIKNKLFTILSCAVITTSCSISFLIFGYLHDADFYSLSFALSSLSAWIIIKKNKWVAVPFIVLSLSIYQAYLQFLLCILIIYEMVNAINNIYIYIYKFISNILVVFLSVVIYYVLCSILKNVFINNFNYVYNSVTYFSFNEFFSNIRIRFDYFLTSYINYFLHPNSHNVVLVKYINISILMTTIFVIVKSFVANNKSLLCILYFCLLSILLVFSINIFTMVLCQYHILSLISFSILYLFVFVVYENLNMNDHVVKSMIIILLSIFVWDNIIYCNEISLKKELDYNETISTYTRILNDIEHTEGYKIGESKVALIGNLNDSYFGNNREGFNYSAYIYSNNFLSLYESNQETFINTFLNYPIIFANQSEKEEILNSDYYANMDVWPNINSIYINDDGILIVKLSNK